jgi:hypothetical protein
MQANPTKINKVNVTWCKDKENLKISKFKDFKKNRRQVSLLAVLCCTNFWGEGYKVKGERGLTRQHHYPLSIEPSFRAKRSGVEESAAMPSCPTQTACVPGQIPPLRGSSLAASVGMTGELKIES